MNETFYIQISVAVLALIIVILVGAAGVAIWTNGKLRADPDFEALRGKRPEGYWTGIGLALGLALGIPLGLAVDSTAVGPAMGLAMGVAFGAALERRHKGETRPLTSYEMRARRWMTWVAVAVVVLLGAAVVAGVVAALLR